MEMEHYHLIVVLASVILLMTKHADCENGWKTGIAMLSNKPNASANIGVGCGYGDLRLEEYNTYLATVSTALFNRSCGSCYKVKCSDGTRCYVPEPIFIKAVGVISDAYPPSRHIDLSPPDFDNTNAGAIFPVHYIRVSCKVEGGIRFTLIDRSHFKILVRITNVGGAGDVSGVWIKGMSTGWEPMVRNRGQIWRGSSSFIGQSLSFKVTTSDGLTVVSDDIAPANWNIGETFTGNQFN